MISVQSGMTTETSTVCLSHTCHRHVQRNVKNLQKRQNSDNTLAVKQKVYMRLGFIDF